MRLIVITGVSRGLGFALLEQIKTNDKDQIVAIGRRCTIKNKKNMHFIKRDLSLPDLSFSIDEFPDNPKINEIIFINNAGVVTPIGAVARLKKQEIMQTVLVNYYAPIIISQTLLSIAKNNNVPFRIINISTGAAERPFFGWSIYCSSKAASKMFFECLQLEDNVSVSQISPGVIDTEMQGEIRKADINDFPMKEEFIAYKENNLLQSPSTVARSILESEGLI